MPGSSFHPSILVPKGYPPKIKNKKVIINVSEITLIRIHKNENQMSREEEILTLKKFSKYS